MVIQVEVVGTDGGKLKLTGEGALPVVVHDHPETGDDFQGETFASNFTNSAGSNDMAVDGSVNFVDFAVRASNDYDIWVKTIKIIVSDAGATLAEFGNLAELTNGVDFVRVSNQSGERPIKTGLKTNLDLVRMGNGPAFGTGTNAFKADISGGGGDSYLIDIFIDQLFGFRDGVRLKKGTTEALIFRIRDNLSTVTRFEADAYGRQI